MRPPDAPVWLPFPAIFRAGLGAYALRFFLGLVLLTAGGLKAHQLATEPVAEVGLLTSRWFLIAVVEFELFFGLWLLSGLYPGPTQLVALAFFLLLFGVSLFQVLANKESCGCFGSVPISPWYTLVFDLLAVIALSWYAPLLAGSPTIRSHAWRFGAMTALFLVVAIPTTWAMVNYTPASLMADGDFEGDSHTVVLQPNTWVDQRFPPGRAHLR